MRLPTTVRSPFAFFLIALLGSALCVSTSLAETKPHPNVLILYVDEYAIRDGKWLLIDAKTGYVSGRNQGWESRRQIPADDRQPHELHDLSVDIGQSENVANEFPEIGERMKVLLKTIRENGYPE